MSQPRLARTDLLEALEKELDEAGFKYREKCGRKHGRILVDVDGKEEPIFVSGTPSDHRAIKNAVGHLRRKIREWRGEMKPQQVDLIEPSSALVYNGTIIRERGETISLTDMWKADGSVANREPFNWSRKEGRRFINDVATEHNLPASQVMNVKRGKGGGTFAHWQVAMAYAQYLSTDFHMWCNRVVKSHMTGEPLEEDHSSLPAFPTVQGDDVSALLEVLSDMQTALITAVQKNDAAALERVEDIRGAILHYLKVQLKEPSLAFFDEMRTRNQRSYDRDDLVIREVRALSASISSLIQKAEQPLLSRSFVWADWFDHDKIYQTYFPDQVIPNRRFLSQAISKSLDSYCKRRQRGFDMQSRRIGGRNVNLWHRDSVEPWLKVHGREIVRTHLAKCRRSGDVVEFKKAK